MADTLWAPYPGDKPQITAEALADTVRPDSNEPNIPDFEVLPQIAGIDYPVYRAHASPEERDSEVRPREKGRVLETLLYESAEFVSARKELEKLIYSKDRKADDIAVPESFVDALMALHVRGQRKGEEENTDGEKQRLLDFLILSQQGFEGPVSRQLPTDLIFELQDLISDPLACRCLWATLQLSKPGRVPEPVLDMLTYIHPA